MKRLPVANVALFACLAAAGAGLDLLTKWLAFTRIGEPTSRHVLWPGVFSFTTSYNEGALWGIGRNIPGSNFLFAALSVVAALAILYWLFWRGGAQERTLSLALGLIMAGVIGNCYDRLVWGKVRDWIYVERINLYFKVFDWPIFNIADSCLVCGAGVLVAHAAYSEWRMSRAAAPAVATSLDVEEQSPRTTI